MQKKSLPPPRPSQIQPKPPPRPSQIQPKTVKKESKVAPAAVKKAPSKGIGETPRESTNTKPPEDEELPPPPSASPSTTQQIVVNKCDNVNPCYCCLSCNCLLRHCCVVIALSFFVVAIFLILEISLDWVGYSQCDRQIEECVKAAQNSSTHKSCKLVCNADFRQANDTIQFLQLIVSGALGALVLFAVYKRRALPALLGAILILIETALAVTSRILHHYITREEDAAMSPLFGLGLFLLSLLWSYFAVCVYFLHRQIRAKRDLVNAKEEELAAIYGPGRYPTPDKYSPPIPGSGNSSNPLLLPPGVFYPPGWLLDSRPPSPNQDWSPLRPND